MAKVMNKKRKSGFVISVQRIGLNTTRQTHTDKKREAERICSEINSREMLVAKDYDHSFHTEWNLAQRREFILFGIEPASEELTVRDACDMYVQSIQDAGRALTTVNGYKHQLKRVYSQFGDDSIESLNHQKLQKFLDWLNKQVITTGKNIGSTLSIDSQEGTMERFKAVVKHAVAKGYANVSTEIFDCLTYAVGKPTLLDRLDRWCTFSDRITELNELGVDINTEGAFREVILSKDELKEHLEFLKEKLWIDGTKESRRLFAAIMFCKVTGLRRSELVRVRRSDLRLDDLTVVTWKRKGRKDKPIWGHRAAITEEVKVYLKGILHQMDEGQECIFTETDEHAPVGLKDSWNEEKETRIAASYGKQLKKALRNSKWSGATGWHLYRHTLASLLLLEGKTQSEVMDAIG